MLVDRGGRVLMPHTPVDGCGHPLESVHVKDMVTIDASSRIGASPGGPVLTEQPQAPLDVCIYRIQDGDPTVGTFVRGMRPHGAAATRLRSALTGAGPRGGCADQPEFATVTAHGGTIFGCWRLERDEARVTLGAASDPSVVRELVGRN